LSLKAGVSFTYTPEELKQVLLAGAASYPFLGVSFLIYGGLLAWLYIRVC